MVTLLETFLSEGPGDMRVAQKFRELLLQDYPEGKITVAQAYELYARAQKEIGIRVSKAPNAGSVRQALMSLERWGASPDKVMANRYRGGEPDGHFPSMSKSTVWTFDPKVVKIDASPRVMPKSERGDLKTQFKAALEVVYKLQQKYGVPHPYVTAYNREKPHIETDPWEDHDLMQTGEWEKREKEVEEFDKSIETIQDITNKIGANSARAAARQIGYELPEGGWRGAIFYKSPYDPEKKMIKKIQPKLTEVFLFEGNATKKFQELLLKNFPDGVVTVQQARELYRDARRKAGHPNPDRFTDQTFRSALMSLTKARGAYRDATRGGPAAVHTWPSMKKDNLWQFDPDKLKASIKNPEPDVPEEDRLAGARKMMDDLESLLKRNREFQEKFGAYPTEQTRRKYDPREYDPWDWHDISSDPERLRTLNAAKKLYDEFISIRKKILTISRKIGEPATMAVVNKFDPDARGLTDLLWKYKPKP